MIPFLDLKREHGLLKERISKVMERVIYDNSNFILGREGELFETEFANFSGKKYGVGVNSATDALEISLLALNIKLGDQVILPVNTAIPTAMAVSNVGAVPVFTDVGEDFLIDTNDLERKITKKTKAIIPVHLYGLACDLDTINTIARVYDLPVIEDCAQAHGSEYKGIKVPIDDIGCFSFYPSKNLGALGDGGMIITNRKNLSDKLKLLRNYGQKDKYNASIVGRNTRLDEIQAAVLRLKLEHLDEWNSRRIELASLYNSELEGFVKIPKHDENKKHVYHLYVIRTSERDKLMKNLRENEITTLIHYPIPLHLQEAFSGLGYKAGDFPNAERFSKEILSLPLFPGITNEEVSEVSARVKKFIGRI